MRKTFGMKLGAVALAFLAGCSPRPNVTLNATCIACAGNPALHPTTHVNEISARIPKLSPEPVTYSWHGVTYQGEAALLAALPGELAAATARIQPLPSPPAASLRLILPQRAAFDIIRSDTNPEGAAEARDALLKFNQAVDAARPAAIQKSGLFSAVTVETAMAPVALPAAAPADYVLWLDGTQWKIRHASGNVFPVTAADSTNLQSWVQALATSVSFVNKMPNLALQLNYKQDIGQLYFSFVGQDYFSLDTLTPAVNEEFLHRAQQTAPAADRLGGRAKLVLATGKSFPPMTILARSEDAKKLGQEGSRAYFVAYARGIADALRQSRIFDRLEVVTNDQTDASLDGYDWVIWEHPTAAGQWRYRLAGSNDAFTVVGKGDLDPAGFPAQLVEAIRKAKMPAPAQ